MRPPNKPLKSQDKLRAYVTQNACRMALMLQTQVSKSNPTARLRDIDAQWAKRYAGGRVNKNIRHRVIKALGLMNTAGILEVKGDDIVVLNFEWLSLSAGNLAVVQDAKGGAISPGNWSSRPKVPPPLQALMDSTYRR